MSTYQFQDHVARLLPSLSREQLTDFITAYARCVSEEQEEAFSGSWSGCAGTARLAVHRSPA